MQQYPTTAPTKMTATAKTTKIMKTAQKKGKQSTSHRYNLVPLLRSRPGGVRRELVV